MSKVSRLEEDNSKLKKEKVRDSSYVPCLLYLKNFLVPVFGSYGYPTSDKLYKGSTQKLDREIY